jgi:hypothetical protein
LDPLNRGALAKVIIESCIEINDPKYSSIRIKYFAEGDPEKKCGLLLEMEDYVAELKKEGKRIEYPSCSDLHSFLQPLAMQYIDIRKEITKKGLLNQKSPNFDPVIAKKAALYGNGWLMYDEAGLINPASSNFDPLFAKTPWIFMESVHWNPKLGASVVEWVLKQEKAKSIYEITHKPFEKYHLYGFIGYYDRKGNKEKIKKEAPHLYAYTQV